MPYAARYNQVLKHSNHHPTAKYVIPKYVYEKQRWCLPGQGKSGLPEWFFYINIVHLVGPVGHLYYYEGHPRGYKYIYWKKL